MHFSNEIYSHIDNGEFEEFWSKCNELIKGKIEKREFISRLKENISKIGPAKSRELISKQHYNQPINGENRQLFVLNFSAEYADGKVNEQLTLVFSEKWEVIGVRSKKI